MAYQDKTDIYGDFLIKFTEEILFIIKARQKQRELFIQEQERAAREIQAEKLRLKFVKPEQKQVERPIIIPMAPRILSKPSKTQIRVIQKNIEQPKKIMSPEVIKVQVVTENKPNQYGIEFGRLTSIVLNPQVSYIDCAGPNKDITVKTNRIFKADITLSKEEIEAIIKSFSERARIPLVEGMLKARVMNLEMAAVVTLAGSSFVLKKYREIPNTLNQMPMPRPQIPNNTKIQKINIK
ncbi:hypothetical protein FJZ17_01590 [Candidatus Pacearchaeota archaeon]|nr:hypothetical protein [Candidatus Pacearchaeota archaeon]